MESSAGWATGASRAADEVDANAAVAADTNAAAEASARKPEASLGQKYIGS